MQDHEARDDFPKIAANALHREIFLLAPAAKCFIKDTAKDILAWDVLKEKKYFALQERLRVNLPAHWEGAARVIGPVPLPPVSPSPTTNNGTVTMTPLVVGLSTAPGQLNVQLPPTAPASTGATSSPHGTAAGGASVATAQSASVAPAQMPVALEVGGSVPANSSSALDGPPAPMEIGVTAPTNASSALGGPPALSANIPSGSHGEHATRPPAATAAARQRFVPDCIDLPGGGAAAAGRQSVDPEWIDVVGGGATATPLIATGTEKRSRETEAGQASAAPPAAALPTGVRVEQQLVPITSRAAAPAMSDRERAANARARKKLKKQQEEQAKQQK